MLKLSRDDWDSIRAERETGVSFRALEAKWKISNVSICKRAKKEGWGDGRDIQGAIRAKVSEKISGISSTASPEKKAEAIDAEAERRAAVRLRHRQECEQIAVLRQEAIKCRKAEIDTGDIEERVGRVKEAFEKAKLAKILAESLSIQHICECRAWGLDVIEYDLSKLSDDQLQNLVKGKSIKA